MDLNDSSQFNGFSVQMSSLLLFKANKYISSMSSSSFCLFMFSFFFLKRLLPFSASFFLLCITSFKVNSPSAAYSAACVLFLLSCICLAFFAVYSCVVGLFCSCVSVCLARLLAFGATFLLVFIFSLFNYRSSWSYSRESTHTKNVSTIIIIGSSSRRVEKKTVYCVSVWTYPL